MSNAMATRAETSIIEQVMILGDLSKLTPEQRVSYYMETCKSLGLNPMTRPFDYINLSGKLTLYAKKDTTEQLRKIHEVTIDNLDITYPDDLVVVTVAGHDKTGRRDTDIGVVTIGTLKGDAKANAVMKAITKAKRRFTLSICGLGWMDETEIETVPGARPVKVTDDGEIIDAQPTNGNGNALNAAKMRRTKKGTLFGDMSREQLELVMLKGDDADKDAAQLILDSWQAEPPVPEEPPA